MALKKNLVLENGLTVNDSYIRVENVGGGKEGAVIEVNCYLSQEAYKEGKKPVNPVPLNYRFIPDCTDSGANFIKQGYEYLKTLDEYKDAIDC